MKKCLLGAAVALGALCAQADFSYRSTLTVSGYSAATALENFPVLVRLSQGAPQGFDYALVNANGYDLKFTDESGEVVYPHQIDTWNPSGESLVWVKLPSLEAGAKFLMYFGDASINEPPASQTDGTVWTGASGANADYAGVWHLGESSGVSKDSTVGGIGDATPTRSSDKKESTVMVGAAGKIGICRSSPATEKHYLSMNSYKSLAVGTSFTFSGWYYQTVQSGTGASSGYCRLVARSGNNKFDDWELQSNNSDTSFNYTGASGTSPAGGNKKSLTASPTPSIKNHWRHFVVVADGTSAAIYVDGVCLASTDDTFAPTDGNNKFAIGCSSDGDQGGYFAGYYDEIRLRRGAVSADWAKAEFDTVDNADFLTYGAAEPLFSGGYLNVTSCGPAYGSPSPAYGVKAGLSEGDSFTCSAPDWTEIDGERAYVTGYVVSNILENGEYAFAYDGEGNSFEYTHGACNATLYWIWKHEYELKVSADDPTACSFNYEASNWIDENVEVSVTCTPVAGRSKYCWMGDFDKSQVLSDTVTVTMDQPRTLCARFFAGGWQYDAGNKVLSNADWKLTCSCSGTELTVTKAEPMGDGTGCVVCDFTSVYEDTGYTVVGIGWQSVFANSETLVVFKGPDVVKFENNNKDSSAFKNCTALREVTLSPNVAAIYAKTFSGCTQLEKISPTEFGGDAFEQAFYNCSSLVGPLSYPSAKKIYTRAFSGCTVLQGVSCPLATSVGHNAFFNCKGLTTLSLSQVTEVSLNNGSAEVFTGCTALKTLELDALTAIPNSLCNGLSALTTFKINPNVTTIGALAFFGSGITNFGVTEFLVLTSIGDRAFRGCSSLVEFPDCPALTTLTGGTTFSGTKIRTFRAPLLQTLPGGDGNYSQFKDNKQLEEVYLPSVTSIGNYAFSGCSSLTNVTPWLSGVTSVGQCAFSGCKKLKGDLILDSITTIGGNAFENCHAVTNVYVDAGERSVSLGSYAFSYLAVGYKVFWHGNAPTGTVGTRPFRHNDSSTLPVLYIDEGQYDTWASYFGNQFYSAETVKDQKPGYISPTYNCPKKMLGLYTTNFGGLTNPANNGYAWIAAMPAEKGTVLMLL